MVTPTPEERWPGVLATPNERERIAQELRRRWIEGGFQALPEDLRGPKIFEIRAPEGGLNERNAWALIDDVRGHLNKTPLRRKNQYGDYSRNIPQLGAEIPRWGDRRGTGAVLQVGDQIYTGVNSGALRSNPRNLRPSRFARKELGLSRAGEARPVYHAETNVLIRAWEHSGRDLPEELTLYVDRKTCRGCEGILPEVLDVIGVEKLQIVMKSGKVHIVERLRRSDK